MRIKQHEVPQPTVSLSAHFACEYRVDEFSTPSLRALSNEQLFVEIPISITVSIRISFYQSVTRFDTVRQGYGLAYDFDTLSNLCTYSC